MIPVGSMRRRRLDREGQALFLQSLLAFGGFYLAHRLFVVIQKARWVDLGAVTSAHVPPLYATWDLRWSLWVLPALAVLALFVGQAGRLYRSDSLRTWKVLALSWLWFMVIGLAISSINNTGRPGGRVRLAFLQPYERTGLEYIGAVPLIEKNGVRAFLWRYSEPGDVRDVPLHVMTHPPGGVLFLWWVSLLLGNSVMAASLANLAFTALAVVGVWLLARILYGETMARYALALYLLVPSVMLYSATSMDGPFAVFPVFSVSFFFLGLKTRRWGWGAVSGLFLALGLFMTYAITFLGLLYAVFAVLLILEDRSRWPWVIRQLLALALAVLGFYLVLYLAWGFNPVLAVLNSIEADHRIMASMPMTPKRWWVHGTANLTAFLFAMGVPVVILWGQALLKRRSRGSSERPALDVFQPGFTIALLLIAFSTLYTLETERIWMFMAPLMVVPAARHLRELCAQSSQSSAWIVALSLMAIQLFAYELCLYTYW